MLALGGLDVVCGVRLCLVTGFMFDDGWCPLGLGFVLWPCLMTGFIFGGGCCPAIATGLGALKVVEFLPFGISS